MRFWVDNFWSDDFWKTLFWSETISSDVDQVAIQLPKTRFKEGDNFTLTANFRQVSTKTAAIPVSVHYRIDCLTTQKQIKDWTAVSAASEVSITVNTSMVKYFNRTERKRITVASDKGTDTETIGIGHWIVVNIVD